MSPIALVYDVASATMNGISYSSPVDALSHLGRASEADEWGSEPYLDLQYDDLALVIGLDKAGVQDYGISFSRKGPLRLGSVAPCRGVTIVLAGRTDVVAHATSADQLDDMLGAPYDRFHYSNGDMCSLYTIDGSHFIATHSKDGRSLLRLDVAEAAEEGTMAMESPRD